MRSRALENWCLGFYWNLAVGIWNFLGGVWILDLSSQARMFSRPMQTVAETRTTHSLPTVLLKPGEADRILAGHPWVYHSSVLRLSQEASDGALVQVKDHRQRLLGTG